MNTRFRIVLVALLSCALLGCATAPGVWKASAVAEQPHTYVRLTYQGETVATVETATIRKLIEIKDRVERAAGIGFVEFFIATGDEPNAFASVTKQGPVVAVNLAMLRLFGTDWDAFAAILGHEYAHLALNHGGVRQQREQVRQGAAGVLGFVLGAAGVPMGGTIADVATTAVSTVYSRDEERDADRYGMDYMKRAGFDPKGAARAWERMSKVSSFSIPFLSTHPPSTERLETMKRLAEQ